jgi:hypothetical protein
MATLTNRLTGGALIGLAGLHVAWGLGSAVPFADRSQLADAVVGTKEVPPPSACFAVAAALAAGSALVLNVPTLPPLLRRSGLLAMAGAFGARAMLGFVGRTEVISPGSTSDRFVSLDRQLYAPLCVGLTIGSLAEVVGRGCNR